MSYLIFNLRLRAIRASDNVWIKHILGLTGLVTTGLRVLGPKQSMTIIGLTLTPLTEFQRPNELILMQLKCSGDSKLFEAKMYSIANKRPGKPGDILIAFIRRWKVGVTEILLFKELFLL